MSNKLLHETVSSQLEYKNPYMEIYRDEVKRPNGEVKPYWIMKRPDFVLSIPLIDKDTTILVGQYRIPISKYSWEFPMGFAPNVNPLEMAQQELKEETGFTSENWKHIRNFYPMPGHNVQQCHIFVAHDVVAGKATPEPTEFMEIAQVGIQEVKKMIETGKIFEGQTIIAYHFLEQYIKTL
jgi:8-oxo-dGTP pyrophosphatase MutT (NUDIX family)